MKVCYKIINGSIRGVEQLVNERINLFSSACREERHENSNKPYREKSNNKIILYTTSLGYIRKTKSECLQAKKIFRCLMLKTEERDIFDPQHRQEFVKLFKGLSPPQVVIQNKHIGGMRELERIVETGEIIPLTQGIEKVVNFMYPCKNCAGHGYINCRVCIGSCRSKTIRIGPSRELSNLKCTYCNDGLVRCELCVDIVH